jgi:hypothetical protein
MTAFDYVFGIVYNVMDVAGNIFFLEIINPTDPNSSTDFIPDPTKPFSLAIKSY